MVVSRPCVVLKSPVMLKSFRSDGTLDYYGNVLQYGGGCSSYIAGSISEEQLSRNN